MKSESEFYRGGVWGLICVSLPVTMHLMTAAQLAYTHGFGAETHGFYFQLLIFIVTLFYPTGIEGYTLEDIRDAIAVRPKTTPVEAAPAD